MYTILKKIVLSFLKVPPEPEDPMGDVSSLKVFRASINFYRYRFYVWLIKNVLGLAFEFGIAIGIFIGLSREPGYVILIFFLSAGGFLLLSLVHTLISYVILRLDYEMRWYKVSDRSLRIREGVVNVKEMTMTFANIQNISINQGPIQRFFKIADLRVESAGGSSVIAGQQNADNSSNMHVAFFRGVDNAREIADLMKERLKLMKSSGLGDHDDDVETSSDLPDNPPKTPVTGDVISLLNSIRKEAYSFRQAVERISP